LARLKAANNAITKLTVGITAADTSFTVEDAALFPDAPFRVTIDAEIMQVEVIDKLTNTFSAVQRGIEGTVAAPHNNGAEVANRWTAGYLETLATLEESQAMATTAGSEAKTHAEAYADDVAATAETSAKTHATGLVGTLSSLLTTAKDNIVAAINEIFAGLGALETDVAAHKADTVNPHSVTAAQIGYTASDVLTKLKTVDGAGSGLDTDLVRGKTPVLIAYGSYSGNESTRTITVGFRPKFVIIQGNSLDESSKWRFTATLVEGYTVMHYTSNTIDCHSYVYINSSGFRLKSGSDFHYANASGESYYWTAVG